MWNLEEDGVICPRSDRKYLLQCWGWVFWFQILCFSWQLSLGCLSFKKNNESKSVSHSYPTLWDSTDCSPPGSSVFGILQARILTGVGSHSLLQGIFLTQGLKDLLHCRWILYCLSHQGLLSFKTPLNLSQNNVGKPNNFYLKPILWNLP